MKSRVRFAAAKQAFYKDRSRSGISAEERADKLFKVADLLENRAEAAARAECINNGKPLREAEADVSDAVHCFRYFAGMATKPQGGTYQTPHGFGRIRSFTVHGPIGVCGLITPWNYPLLIGVRKLAPALAAGNCVVYKPSSDTPLSSKILFEIFEEAGLPPGTANMVMGPGGVVGRELAESADVDMIPFTGSTETGLDIARRATGNLKRVSLELGGKSPNIIFADADLEGAVEWAMSCAKGFYITPTIFDACTSDMRIVREEIFGPVATVQSFETEEEAIRMANDTEYGLAGGVFTTDGARALRVAEGIRAGITWINCYNPTFNEAPWGGYKKSGVGRELGAKGFEEYQEIKQVNIHMAPGPVGWYTDG